MYADTEFKTEVCYWLIIVCCLDVLVCRYIWPPFHISHCYDIVKDVRVNCEEKHACDRRYRQICENVSCL